MGDVPCWAQGVISHTQRRERSVIGITGACGAACASSHSPISSLYLMRCDARAPWFREQETALDAVSLVVLSSDVVSDALPLVLSEALLILGTPRCAGTQVRRAPLVGHVVQT